MTNEETLAFLEKVKALGVTKLTLPCGLSVEFPPTGPTPSSKKVPEDKKEFPFRKLTKSDAVKDEEALSNRLMELASRGT